MKSNSLFNQDGNRLIDVDGYIPSPVSSDNYEPSFEPDNSSDNDESSESFSSDEREEESGINKEEAEKNAQIFISFRQISGFNYDGRTITFNFYGLTSQDLAVQYYLTLLVQLIGSKGLEDKIRANCSLQNDVTLNRALSALSNFLCKIENVEGDYTSLRLHSSDDIVGIPDDETS